MKISKQTVMKVILIQIVGLVGFVMYTIKEEKASRDIVRIITIGSKTSSYMSVMNEFSNKDKTAEGFQLQLKQHRFNEIPLNYNNLRLFLQEGEAEGKYSILVLMKTTLAGDVISFVVAVDGVKDKKLYYMGKEKMGSMADDRYTPLSVALNGQPVEIMKKWLNSDEPHCAVIKLDKDINEIDAKH